MSNMIHQGKPTPQQSVEVQSAKPTPTSLSSARPAQLRQGQVAPEQVLHLQRTIGNQAVARLLNRHAPVVQPKLTVGPVGDAYEQEAERIAAQVAKGPAPVQRHTEDDPSSDEVQRSPLAAAITPNDASAAAPPMSHMELELVWLGAMSASSPWSMS